MNEFPDTVQLTAFEVNFRATFITSSPLCNYIKVDVASEREDALIKAAYLRGAMDRNTCYPTRVDGVIYKDAGLEKLK